MQTSKNCFVNIITYLLYLWIIDGCQLQTSQECLGNYIGIKTPDIYFSGEMTRSVSTFLISIMWMMNPGSLVLLAVEVEKIATKDIFMFSDYFDKIQPLENRYFELLRYPISLKYGENKHFQNIANQVLILTIILCRSIKC